MAHRKSYRRSNLQKGKKLALAELARRNDTALIGVPNPTQSAQARLHRKRLQLAR